MSCTQCRGIVQEFNSSVARRELRRYRRRGPRGTTRTLLDLLRGEGVRGRTFLDVGGGVGVIQHELMASGASSGVDVDASPAYLAACRDEAAKRGYVQRIRYLQGDLIDVASSVDAADIVTLDRVLCCYPDMPTLVDASASRARRIYGLVIPRESRFMRFAVRAVNLIQTLRRRPFRLFLHASTDIDARVAAYGLDKRYHGQTIFWQVLLYTRRDPDRAAPPGVSTG
ncbi:MAG: class I SAM-dependent methyltransferase [Gemmatimonadetes bacterium]|nr:class I SAM-dependent methyltransferase [Gemmatimonadota bacterium]